MKKKLTNALRELKYLRWNIELNNGHCKKRYLLSQIDKIEKYILGK